MKKVYIPTEEELSKLEKLGVNTYYYLLTKTIESMIMSDILYEEDMFDIAYDDFADIPEIIYTIAKMYPERIANSQSASRDIGLCEKIMPVLIQPNKSIYGLDNMTNFKEEVLTSKSAVESIIKTLSDKLPTCPRYRFEYMGPNAALDRIFAGELEIEDMNWQTLMTLSTIEPIYLAKNRKGIILPKDVETAIVKYAHIYGIDAYGVRGGLPREQTEKIKRLTRRLDIHKQYYNL